MKLQEAEAVCQDLIMGTGMLASHFSQWTVCGSIRRKKEEVKDIDIVAVEKTNYQFGEPTLSARIRELDGEGPKLPTQNKRFLDGKSIKRFMYKGIMIDIYLATEKNFSCLSLIRTGSEGHNIRLATLAKGKNMRLFASGEGVCEYVMEGNKAIPLKCHAKTEEEILTLLLGRVPEPEKRD